jgi:organic hydroperoxide reductase OsmC/OhrA
MRISAIVRNAPGRHEATVRTNDATQSLPIAAKASGRGSAVNGGELLMLALATCYCNDLYREAERLGIVIDGVEVEARATFAGVGLAATDISYRVDVQSSAAPDAVAALVSHTDTVAEIHNTLRGGAAVTLVERSAER